MWEFMTEVANSFWATGDMAWEIFSTLMAWAMIIGSVIFFGGLVIGIAITIIECIRAKIEEKVVEKKYGKEK